MFCQAMFICFPIRRRHATGVTRLKTVTNIMMPSSAVQGEVISARVDVANQGGSKETFSVKLIDATDGIGIASKTVTLSAGGKDGLDDVADLIFNPEIDGVNRLGNGITAGGDVNGDSYPDLLINATKYNEAQGRAYLNHGGPAMDNIPDMVFTGEHKGDHSSLT